MAVLPTALQQKRMHTLRGATLAVGHYAIGMSRYRVIDGQSFLLYTSIQVLGHVSVRPSS